MKGKKKWSTFILLLIFFVGLSVMLYPAISSYWNSRTQTQAIIDYQAMLDNIPKKDYTAIFEKAENYNDELAELDYPLLEHDRVKGYNETLDISNTGMMGYLSIEKINLELPIYHTTDDDVLNVAVGHLEGTSLPVGGESTHCVVSAHRGLPSATLFTNLDHLEIGDTFTVKVLDRTLTYQVDQIKTVAPDDSSELAIIDGKDYCTLLTCTPYGINSHRLIVRGKRIATAEQREIYITSEAFQIDSLIVTPIVALPILLTLMLIVLFKPIKKTDGDDLE